MLIEKMDDEIIITTKSGLKTERVVIKSDEFISQYEFDCHFDDLIEELLYDDELILVKTLK